MNKLQQKIAEFVNKNRILSFFILSLVILIQFFYLQTFITIDSDLKSLFDKNSIIVTELDELEEQMPNFSSILVIASSPDRKKNIEALRKIINIIEKDPLIRYVDLERETDYLKEHALLYVPLEKLKKTEKKIRRNIANYTVSTFASAEPGLQEKLEVNNILEEILETSRKYRNDYKFRKYMEVQNGRLVAMYVRPKCSDTNLSEIQRAFKIIDRAIIASEVEKTGVRVEVSGPFRKKLTDTLDILNNYIAAILTAFILMLILTGYHYRSLKITVILAVSIFTGLLSALTFINIFNGLNIAILLSFPLIMGIGLNSVISHLNRHLKNEDFCSVGKYQWTRSILFSAIMVILSLIPFLSGSFKGFSDFMLGAFTGVLFFIPASIFSATILIHGLRLKPFYISYKNSFWYLTVFVIVLSAGAVLSLFIENSFNKTEKKRSLCSEYSDEAKNDINSFLAAGLPSFIITASAEETRDASETLDRMKKDPNKKIRLNNYISISKFIPENQKEKLITLDYIKRYINQKENLLDKKTSEKYHRDFEPYLNIKNKITKKNLPLWIRDKLSLKDGSIDRLLVLGLGGNKSDVETVAEIKREYGTIKGRKNYYTLKGSYLLQTDIVNILEKNWWITCLISFIIASLILQIRSGTFNINILLRTISFGIGLSFLFIPFAAGIEQNIFNIAVFPIVTGFGIHSLITEINENRNHYRDRKEDSGCCIFRRNTHIASMTLFAFFFILALSHHPGQRSFGILAATGILSTSASGLLFHDLLEKTSKKIIREINKWRKKCTE